MTAAERPLTDMSAQHDEAIARAIRVVSGSIVVPSDVTSLRRVLADLGLSIVATAERDALVDALKGARVVIEACRPRYEECSAQLNAAIDKRIAAIHAALAGVAS